MAKIARHPPQDVTLSLARRASVGAESSAANAIGVDSRNHRTRRSRGSLPIFNDKSRYTSKLAHVVRDQSASIRDRLSRQQ